MLIMYIIYTSTITHILKFVGIFEPSTPQPTTQSPDGSALFVQVVTETPEKPENKVSKVRVVTSKSVVTSRPVPLDQEFTFSFGEQIDDGDLRLKQQASERIDNWIPEDESVNQVEV